MQADPYHGAVTVFDVKGDDERKFDLDDIEIVCEEDGSRTIWLGLGYTYDIYALGVNDTKPTVWSLMHVDSAVYETDPKSPTAFPDSPIPFPRVGLLAAFWPRGASG